MYRSPGSRRFVEVNRRNLPAFVSGDPAPGPGKSVLRFASNHAAVSRPRQKGGADKRIYDTLTRRGVQSQQPCGLRRREPKTWHFIEL